MDMKIEKPVNPAERAISWRSNGREVSRTRPDFELGLEGGYTSEAAHCKEVEEYLARVGDDGWFGYNHLRGKESVMLREGGCIARAPRREL